MYLQSLNGQKLSDVTQTSQERLKSIQAVLRQQSQAAPLILHRTQSHPAADFFFFFFLTCVQTDLSVDTPDLLHLPQYLFR